MGAGYQARGVALHQLRRRAMCLTSAGLAFVPVDGWAARVHRLGVLRSETSTVVWRQLSEALAALGYVRGANLQIEERSVSPTTQAFQQAALELVNANVDVLVTISTPALIGAINATRTTPIVMAGGATPVELGMVASLAHPGGNVTGVTNIPDAAFSGKMLALLKEVAPKIARVAVVFDPRFQASREAPIQAAARELGIQASLVPVTGFEELVAGLERRADAVVAFPVSQVNAMEKRLTEFLARQRMPSTFGSASAVRNGGLMSYFASWQDIMGKAARSVDRVLRGAKPADLPIELPGRFDLALNLRTAEHLGLRVPTSLLLQATEVIR